MNLSSLSRKWLLSRWIPLVLMIAILLLAAGVRFYRLGAQSLWYDEGGTVAVALRSFPEIVQRVAADVHVPVYYWGMHIWIGLVGETEFALRMFSALCTLLAIALTYGLGKRLYGVPAGIAAAAFVALNTFSIYYAQEARMYALLTTIAVASMWIFVAFIRRPVWRTGIAFAVLNAVGLYTHYSYPLVMIAQGVLLVLWLGAGALAAFRERGLRAALNQSAPLFGRYVAVNLLTIVLFFPWLLTNGPANLLAQPNISPFVPLERMLRLIQGWLAFGPTFEVSMGGMGVAVYLLLFFGLMTLQDRRRPGHDWWSMLVPVLWVLLTCAIFLSLGLYERYMRFLLPAEIALALWMGRGVWVLWQLQTRERTAPVKYLPKFTAVFVVGALMLNMSNGLNPLYYAPEFQRDDYRSVAQTIRDEAQPGDAVILDAPGQSSIFAYYDHGDAPVYYLPSSPDDAQTLAETRAIIADHSHIFAVLWGTDEQDPRGIVEGALADEAFQLSDEWVGTLRFVRYVTAASLQDARQSGARFGDHITLQQYALSADSVHPGDALLVRLQWTTDAPLTARYKVFVQLLDSNGVLVAQHDGEPGSGLRLTTGWTPGDTVVDNHALRIPSDLSPGTYTLIAGLYAIDDASARLPVNGGTFLSLAVITVAG